MSMCREKPRVRPMPADRGQAAEVYPDADGDVALLGFFHDQADLVLVAEVAGVEAKAVNPSVGALQGELVVEVDVGDEGGCGSAA